jgi:hypothetical protein
MIDDSTRKTLIDIRTSNGTAIPARLTETPVRIVLHTPQVLCQVIVNADHRKTRGELVGRRDA